MNSCHVRSPLQPPQEENSFILSYTINEKQLTQLRVAYEEGSCDIKRTHGNVTVFMTLYCALLGTIARKGYYKCSWTGPCKLQARALLPCFIRKQRSLSAFVANTQGSSTMVNLKNVRDL